MSEWRPIETAPKDDSLVLGFGQWAGEIAGIMSGEEMCIIKWSGSEGRGDYASFDWEVQGGDAYSCWMKPRLWMPLPEKPA